MLNRGRCLNRKSLEVALNINIPWFFRPFSLRWDKWLQLLSLVTGLFSCRLLILTGATRWHLLLKSLPTFPSESGSLQKQEAPEGDLANTGTWEYCLLLSHGNRSFSRGTKGVNFKTHACIKHITLSCSFPLRSNSMSGFSSLSIVICPEKWLKHWEGSGGKTPVALSEFLGQEGSRSEIIHKDRLYFP